MSTPMNNSPSSEYDQPYEPYYVPRRSWDIGWWAVAAILVSILGIVMMAMGFTCCGASPGPNDWMFVPGMFMTPIGAIASVVLAIIAVVKHRGRGIGLTILISYGAFIVLTALGAALDAVFS